MIYKFIPLNLQIFFIYMRICTIWEIIAMKKEFMNIKFVNADYEKITCRIWEI